MTPVNQRIPAMYISKYNRFVDNILGRINKILRRSYDPVRVKLQTNENKNKKNSNKQKKKQNKRRRSNKRDQNEQPENKMAEIELEKLSRSLAAAEEKLNEKSTPMKNENETTKMINEATTRRSSNNNKSNNNKNKKKNGGNKTKAAKKPQKPRATLFGLSSLRRDGDVSVNLMADHTTVKTNFILGPLILKVEKEFGRGVKRELKSATATTAEMHGKLSLRIVQGGAATLHSIKVLQPKQVRIDSTDDHDRTREFVWKRSAQIAQVVSRKLTTATKSMLQPIPPKH